MPFELTDICRAARAEIDVPSAPLVAIRNGAARHVAPPKQRRILPIVLSGLAIALVAAAVASWKNTYVWVGDGHVRVTSKDGVLINHPTAADLAEAEKQADFHVVIPAGLPAGAKLAKLFKGGSSALMLQYDLPGAWRANDHVAWIVLANPKSFDLKHANHTVPSGMLEDAKSLQVGSHIVALFRLRDEMVVVPKGALTTKELNHMEQAMHMGHWRLVSPGGLYIENPTAADVASEARRAAFRVIVPSGFPAGTSVTFVGSSPNGVALQYSLPGAWRANNHLAWVLVANKKTADTDIHRFMSHFPHAKVMARFGVGEETVVFPTSSLTTAEIAKIRASMGLRQ